MQEVIQCLKVMTAETAAEIIPVAAEAVIMQLEQTELEFQRADQVETEQQIQ